MQRRIDVGSVNPGVSEVRPDDMAAHRTRQAMGPGKTWAGILTSLEIITHPDPRRATAMAYCGGFPVMSSVLPWRSCGASWEGATLAEKMSVTLSTLREHIDETTIWGGDWTRRWRAANMSAASVAAPRSLRSPSTRTSRCPRALWLVHREAIGPSITSRSRSTGTSTGLIA